MSESDDYDRYCGEFERPDLSDEDLAEIAYFDALEAEHYADMMSAWAEDIILSLGETL